MSGLGLRLLVELLVGLGLLVMFAVYRGWLFPCERERLLRQRRRHARRTARTIRRMGQIRVDTIARMDREERRWR